MLVTDEEVMAESEDILVFADEALDAGLRLFPSDGLRRRGRGRSAAGLDRGLGPDGRRFIYAQMLPLRG